MRCGLFGCDHYRAERLQQPAPTSVRLQLSSVWDTGGMIDFRLLFELVVSLADADRGNHKSEALTLVPNNAGNDFSLQRLLFDAIHILVLVGAGDELNSHRLATDNGFRR